MKTAYLHMTSAVVGTHDIRQGVHMMSTVPKTLDICRSTQFNSGRYT